MNQEKNYYENVNRVNGLLNGEIKGEELPTIPQSIVAHEAGNKFVIVDGVMYAVNERYAKSVNKIIANSLVPTMTNEETTLAAPSLVCE